MTPEPGVVSAPDRSPARRRGKREGLLLIALSLVLVLLGSVGVLGVGNLVLVDRLLNHPFVFGCVAAGLFGVGLCLLTARSWLRFLLCCATACVVGGWLLIGLILDDGDFVRSTAAAPSERQYEAVVVESPGVVDPAWYISVRQTRGLLSREWEVGCTRYTVPRVRWDGTARLVVDTDSGSATIRVDPRTGRPQRGEGSLWGC